MRFLILIVFSCILTNLKSQETIDNRYLLSLLRLKSDPELNKVINSTFKYCLDSSNAVNNFRIQDEVWFIPIQYFELKVKASDLNIDSSLISDFETFRSKYVFMPYKLPFLQSLLHPSNSRVVLTFSKPIENFLIAELLDSGYPSSNRGKQGKSVQFLFIFNQQGLIDKVIHAINLYR